MITDIDKYVDETKPDQCKIGLKWMLEKFVSLKSSVYLEIGCAHLATFRLFHERLFHERLVGEGFSIGIDSHPHMEKWNQFRAEFNNSHLIDGSSIDDKIYQQVKTILNGRLIDCLFVDGWHYIDTVEKEWELYSPLVRKGGIIMMHDCDPSPALHIINNNLPDNGQGAGIMYHRLKQQGYNIYLVPQSTIGTAIIEI